VVGLASVATLPEYRRRGHVRRLVDGSLRTWRDDYPLAALWPFEFGNYEQFGWAIGSKVTEYTCDPDALAFARDAAGTVRRVDPDDWDRSTSRDVEDRPVQVRQCPELAALPPADRLSSRNRFTEPIQRRLAIQ